MTLMNSHKLEDTYSNDIEYMKYDGELDQLVYEFSLQPGFKECANISRTVYYTSYLSWIGKVRELFMSYIGDQLVPQISSGEWGLVTNWCDLKIYGEATTYDNVLARFRLGKVSGAVIPLECEFFKVHDGNSLELIAYVEQETTWVEIIGHGKVKPAEFPDYFDEFLKLTERKKLDDVKSDTLEEKDLKLSPGKVMLAVPRRPVTPKSLYSEIFKTSLEDSNLVGNVYYGNYFIWQGRVRDLYVNSISNEYLRGIGDVGEIVCTHSRLNYLRDAMPFDEIVVDLSVRTVYECGADLEFQYYRLLKNGDKEKLAIGQQTIVWLNHDNENNPQTIPLPKKLSDVLIAQSVHESH